MKVLHLVLYQKLYPPKNGGMLRCWNLIDQLSKTVQLDVITLQTDVKQKATADGYNLPKTRFLTPLTFALTSATFIKRLRNAVSFRFFYRTFSSTNSNYLKAIPVLRSIKSNKYDVIIFEHLESLRMLKKIKKYFPSAKLIFDAHNIDHQLLVGKVPLKQLKKIEKLEKSLFTIFDEIIACSEQDAFVLSNINEQKIQVSVVPNGIDCFRNSYQLPDLNAELQFIFCGSLDYHPNQDGLSWFIGSVWPMLVENYPSLKLLVVGRGNPGLSLLHLFENTPSIIFIGEVDNVIPYYRKAQVAIVPLLHGSGTRLKILEAMSLGIPVISTSKGAKGINYSEGSNILIANSGNDFVSAVNKLLKDCVLFSELSRKGRLLIENEYCWNMIREKLFNALKVA